MLIVEALRARQISMQLDHIHTTSLLMQIVYILGDESQTGNMLLHLGKRMMRSIRFCLSDQFPSHGVPFPHQSRITPKRFRCCQFLGSVLGPKASLRIAKRRHTTRGGNTGARQNKYMFRIPDCVEQLRGNFVRWQSRVNEPVNTRLRSPLGILGAPG